REAPPRAGVPSAVALWTARVRNRAREAAASARIRAMTTVHDSLLRRVGPERTRRFARLLRGPFGGPRA
ncbi:MAG: hypothetical protein ACT4PT_07505, partial [Methanobacteriota archaeon]